MNIAVKDISLTRGTKHIFENFSLTFEAHKTTAIIAPSGAGKTTLLDILCNRLKIENGSIEIGDTPISYIFQEDRLLPWHTVQKNIMLPLENMTFTDKEKIERVNKYIKLCGIHDKRHAKPNELSGGERQRVSIARAFSYPSKLLLMDEAFQSLDLHIKFQLLELFENLSVSEKRTSILVTHDIREALCLADRIVVLKGSPLKIELDTPLQHNKDSSIATRYIHLSKENIELQEKILDILSAEK